MHSTHFLNAGFQFSVIVLLAVVPNISAIPNNSQPPRRGVQLRESAVQPSDLPAGWSYLGCYTDSPSLPTLTSAALRDDIVDVQYCAENCDGRGNVYAGVGYGNVCACGDVMTVGSKIAPPEDCNLPCLANSTEICGGIDRLSIYTSWTDETPPPQPTIVESVGSWTVMGCYNDTNDARTLAKKSPGNTSQQLIAGSSVENCIDACGRAGYRLAGVEFANQCRCDNDIKNNGQKIDNNLCPLACAANSTEICGGANSLVIYQNTMNGIQ